MVSVRERINVRASWLFPSLTVLTAVAVKETLWHVNINIINCICDVKRPTALFCPSRSPSLTWYLWMRSWRTSHIRRILKSNWPCFEYCSYEVRFDWKNVKKYQFVQTCRSHNRFSGLLLTLLFMCLFVFAERCWHRRLWSVWKASAWAATSRVSWPRPSLSTLARWGKLSNLPISLHVLTALTSNIPVVVV